MSVRTNRYVLIALLTAATLSLIVLISIGLIVSTDAYNQWNVNAGRSVIVNATVIDPRTRTVLYHRDIWIDKERIGKITPTGTIRIDPNARRIDAAGKFVIPGLWDMHVHLFWRRYMAPFSLDLFLANGVVAVRDMRSDCWEPRDNWQLGCIDEARWAQNGIERGTIRGPRILALSSDFINGPWHGANHEPLPDGAASFMAPHGMNDGIRLARYLKARGVDFAKTYDGMTPEAYRGLTTEARRLGLAVAGHHPPAVPLADLARSGQKSVEHSKGLVRLCSAYYDRYRPIYQCLVEKGGDKEEENYKFNLKLLLDGFSRPRCEAIARLLAQHNVYFVPTLGTSYFDLIAKHWQYELEPRTRYIVPALKRRWIDDAASYASSNAAMAAIYRKRYALGLAATRLAFENGVQVMLGTDANDSSIYPGFSMHDEMVRLAVAGVPKMDVLRAATSVPAAYMGMADRYGGIAPGSASDIVILNGNPLDDMGEIRRVSAVIVRGRVLDRATLDAMLEKAAGRVHSLAPRIELIREWLIARTYRSIRKL